MDPLTAVSLAGTVVQFVDFTAKIVSKARELSSAASGNTQGVSNNQILTTDLLNLTEKLKDGIRTTSDDGLSDDGQVLEEVCNGCIKLSEKMMGRLKSLDVREGDGKFKVILQATRAVWSRPELDDMAKDLARFQSQLQLRVFASFKEKLDLATLASEAKLDECSRKMIAALLDHNEVFETSLHNQTNFITALHQDTRKVTSDEHEITRSVVLKAVNQMGQQRIRRLNQKSASTVEENDELKRQAETRILQSLTFPSIKARYSQVAKAHATTFEWIFKDPKGQAWSDFKEWLQTSDQIYWINGKAGSGKSTLMKYLCEHPKTRELLELWSGSMPLEITTFFFWNSGTTDQKSQTGLLRSILHSVLSKHKSLIPLVFPDQWRDEYVFPTEYSEEFHWDLQSLGKGFELLRNQTDIRICLFIDGLDEYEGDHNGSHADIARLFRTIASSANIKLCLSSRPWLVFEDAFRFSPSLRLQDLTSGDIFRYVEDELNSHDRMVQFWKLDPESAKALADEIVTKASGVFLWVVLVVRSLLDGLTNRDRISDLQRRLQVLPVDLEHLYHHMLFKHIDPFYHEQASQIFQIVRAAKTKKYGIPGQLMLITLAFADEADSTLRITEDLEPLSDKDLRLKCREMRDRLKSRCAGLIEVFRPLSIPYIQEVNFLHRTVRDFLKLPEIWNSLLSRTSSAFDPDEQLLQSYVLQLKLIPKLNSYGEIINTQTQVESALKFARISRNKKHKANVQLLDELDKIVGFHCATMADKGLLLPNPVENSEGLLFHWATGMSRGSPSISAQDSFLSLAVEYGLVEYVAAKLLEDQDLVKTKNGRPLLDYMVNDQDCPAVPRMASLLLDYGADPNEVFDGRSVWQHVLDMITVTTHHISWIEVLKIFLEAGANPSTVSQTCGPTRNNGWQITIASPLALLSHSGALPDAGLEAKLKLQGAPYIAHKIVLSESEDRQAQNSVAFVREKVKEYLRTREISESEALQSHHSEAVVPNKEDLRTLEIPETSTKKRFSLRKLLGIDSRESNS